MTDPDAALDMAEGLYHDGRDAEALALLARIEPSFAPRWLLEAEIRADAEDDGGAAAALERARALLGEDDFDVLLTEGEWHLARWRIAEATRCFEQLDNGWEDALVLERLALLADLRGAFGEADSYHAEAARLDPGAHPRPLRIPRREFERIVEEAAALLPDAFQAELERIPVIVDPVPLRPPGGGRHLPPTLLGLFHGRPLAERELVGGELPPTIHIYQRNLERAVHDLDELREQIRVTLWHELGHALGFDEDGVHAMGLG